MIVKNTPDEVIEYDELNDCYIVYDYLIRDVETNEPTQTYLSKEEYKNILKENFNGLSFRNKS